LRLNNKWQDKGGATFSRGLYKNSALTKHLGIKQLYFKPSKKDLPLISVVIGWGNKPNTTEAQEFAAKHKLPFIRLEDGFIHSMGQGRLGSKSWSLVADELGIFYDASRPSTLETLIKNNKLTEAHRKRSLALISAILAENITKYNNAPLHKLHTLSEYVDPVLVVDQVDGDMSIAAALADQANFGLMLKAAIKENPNSDILIKIHPDVLTGKLKGCLNLSSTLPSNVYTLTDAINPLTLIKHVKKIYVVSSQLGFEGLLCEKTVICFGVPFYSGWGLTDDRMPKELPVFKRRNIERNLAQIFHAAYLDYSSYLHPDTQALCKLEDILEYVKLQHHHYDNNAYPLYCLDFPPWKKRFVISYIQSNDNSVYFVKNAAQAISSGINSRCKVLTWSNKKLEDVNKLIDSHGVEHWRIEDGFIRSVALGSDYAPPASLVIDKSGIYFDPRSESDLETILQSTQFTPELLKRAQTLRSQLITNDISKYNVGIRARHKIFHNSNNQKIILVPGQVDDDASVQLGCAEGLDCNLSLLRVVRSRNPDAFIAYKPHPDVLCGNRKGGIASSTLDDLVDQVIEGTNIASCLHQCDEVHTLTSLVGFESVIREIPTYCYGKPFYSGWGLTVDYDVQKRRTRTLKIDELVAASLILYPTYVNWESGFYTSPEFVIDTIAKKRETSSAVNIENGKTSHAIFKLRNLISALFKPTLK